MPTLTVTDDQLLKAKEAWELGNKGQANSRNIQDKLKEMYNEELDVSTIRGRFLKMGQPLGSGVSNAGVTASRPKGVADILKNKNKPKTIPKQDKVIEPCSNEQSQIPEELKGYIPKEDEFINYVERPVDKRLDNFVLLCGGR